MGMNYAAFADAYGITTKAVRRPFVDKEEEATFPGADHWRVTLTRKVEGRKRTAGFPFSMGSGHKGRAPKVGEVLESLALDCAIVDGESFEGFCSQLGYDTDSRKAEAAYRACKAEAAKLAAFLGPEGFYALLCCEE